MLPFTSTQLTGVVNKRRPVRTPIKDAHFSRGRLVGSSQIQFDVLNGPEGIAVAISAGVKSTKARKTGWETQTVTVPRFSEHDLVKAADMRNLRAPGTVNGSRAMMQLFNDKLDYIRARFDRTQEFMCIKALQGSVVDGNGNVIATYSVPVATAVDFSTDNPIDVFDDAAVDISRALGGDAGNLIAYCGKEAYKKLRGNAKIESLLSGPAGPGMVEGGEVRRVGGVTIRRLPATFLNNSDVETPFLADNAIILASDSMESEMLYAPCETPSGLQLTEYFADTWVERDPAGAMVRVETNPLPLVKRPDSIRQFTVA